MNDSTLEKRKVYLKFLVFIVNLLFYESVCNGSVSLFIFILKELRQVDWSLVSVIYRISNKSCKKFNFFIILYTTMS